MLLDAMCVLVVYHLARSCSVGIRVALLCDLFEFAICCDGQLCFKLAVACVIAGMHEGYK